MKPIPTTYKGRTYRSRLEARWALFYERLNFNVVYEPFTIENNDLSYTPDFWVLRGFENTIPVLIEIKPIAPNKEYIEYLCQIHDPEKSDILICIGDPNLTQPKGIWIQGVKTKEGKKETHINFGFVGFRCPKCGRYTINDLYDGNLYLSCDRYHNLSTGRNTPAAEYAKDFRFDLYTGPSIKEATEYLIS